MGGIFLNGLQTFSLINFCLDLSASDSILFMMIISNSVGSFVYMQDKSSAASISYVNLSNAMINADCKCDNSKCNAGVCGHFLTSLIESKCILLFMILINYFEAIIHIGHIQNPQNGMISKFPIIEIFKKQNIVLGYISIKERDPQELDIV